MIINITLNGLFIFSKADAPLGKLITPLLNIIIHLSIRNLIYGSIMKYLMIYLQNSLQVTKENFTISSIKIFINHLY